jgi:hypothetical protein
VASGATAGGDRTGTYPNPTIWASKVTSSNIVDGTIVDGDVAAANKDGAAGTPSMRTLGPVTAQSTSSAAAANGSALTGSHSDHVHGSPTLDGVVASDFSKGGAVTGGGSGDTTLADVTGMGCAVVVSATYKVEGSIVFDASATGDIKIALTAPTGATLAISVIGPATNNGNNNATSMNIQAITSSGGSVAYGSAGGAPMKSIAFQGTVSTDGTHSGTVQMQMAQNAADGTNATTVKAGSVITVRRIS